MPGFSDYLEAKILDWLFKRTASGTPPNNVYVSLHNGDPEGAGANELQGSNPAADGYSPAYARVQVPTDLDNATNTNWSAKGPGSPSTAQKITNQAIVAFPLPSGAWNQPAGGGAARAILYFGFFDAGSGGNFLGSGKISPADIGVLVQAGQRPSFDANQLAFQVE